MMQSSELLSRMQLRYDVPLRRMELLRRWCSRPTSGSKTATKTHAHQGLVITDTSSASRNEDNYLSRATSSSMNGTVVGLGHLDQ